MYRNYDGSQSTFGDVSLSAGGPNPDNVAVFAAQRTSDSALTIMVISKYLSGTTPVSIALNNFSGTGTAQVYQLTSSNVINRISDLSFNGATAAFTAPAQSITLLVLPAGTPNAPPVAVATATPTSGIGPLTVNFDAAGSYDSDGSISAYSWNFGDGSPASTNVAPSHVYQIAGSFTAVLTVTDNRGATATKQLPITVSPDPNVISAPTNLTGTAGKASAKLTWTDNSTNETGFYVERAVSGSSNFVRVGTVAANVNTFTDSVARGNYVYRVQAFNGSAVSAYSNTVTVRVK
jgi:PKD repeat protein